LYLEANVNIAMSRADVAWRYAANHTGIALKTL
jgi:hypothetical protein